MRKVLYPGSFDPITKGHMNIIEQASYLFDEVIISVFSNKDKKNSMFSLDERVEIIKKIYENIPNIKVILGTGASVDVALNNNCCGIIRGFRGINDFEYEMQLAQINKDISNNKINTICLFADNKYCFISSSAVKEIFSLEKDISKYVIPYVENKMKAKIGE